MTVTANFTAADLHNLLKPFEGITSRRTFNGPNEYVDIATPGINRCGADIREVTPEGVTVYFSRECELIPFDQITRVTVRMASLYEQLSRCDYVRADERLAA